MRTALLETEVNASPHPGPTIKQARGIDLEEAQILQRALLPDGPLVLPDAEFCFRFLPVREVGGDFLDYFEISEDRAGVYLGDVVGKGLPAALYAALVVGAFRGLHKAEMMPDEALALLNRRLRVRPIPGRYCAAHYATLDLKTGLLCGANAGLPYPLHLSASGAHRVGEGGLPIAMFDQSGYDPYSLSLQPGESVLFFTDGILDARNTHGEEFGLNRLTQLCARNWQAPSEALLQCIIGGLEKFSRHPFDDVTMALLRMRENRS